MNLDLTEDQQLLKDMVDRFAADSGGLEAHRGAVASARGFSEETWRQMGELGLLSAIVPEEAGGLGGGGTELMIVAEAIGRHQLSVPYLESAVVAATLVAGADDPVDAALAALVDGSLLFADVTQPLSGDASGLSGEATMVAAGGQADRLIVHTTDALYLVDAAADGVTRTDYPLHGGGRAADIRFDRVAGTRIAGGNALAQLSGAVVARRIAFLAAEALGAAEAAFDTTVDYLKTRAQFGTPIGKNQSLQHRAAEMFVELEQLRSAAILAACSLDEEEDERRRIVAAVALVVAKSARFVAQQAVQLHGGIGVTEEHAVGHWFLRLTAIALLLGGDAGASLLANSGGFISAEPYWEIQS